MPVAQGHPRARVHRGEAEEGPGVVLGFRASLFTLSVPLQILSFPSHLGSQASARPCAHLRHTQTLHRVLKVSIPCFSQSASPYRGLCSLSPF